VKANEEIMVFNSVYGKCQFMVSDKGYSMRRREFLRLSGAGAAAVAMQGCARSWLSPGQGDSTRPNILFCIADDWGWPHAGIYGDSVVSTDTFDRVAENGVLFDYAYVSSPSCTPCRGAILTGQYHWRLKDNANLWSTLDVSIPVYPLLLEKTGYRVGYWRKSWGPGDLKAGGYTDTHPAGKNYNEGFEQFLDSKPKDSPFCFWLGASDPHRGYKEGSGRESGMDLSKIALPKFYPETLKKYGPTSQTITSKCNGSIAIVAGLSNCSKKPANWRTP
jgi:hypothetical protein